MNCRQFALTFHFREPYQVLIDAQMIQDTDRFSMDLVGGLERTLHGKVKPSGSMYICLSMYSADRRSVITQCSIRHLYALPTTEVPTSHKDALIARAKEFERRRCNHHTLEQPLSSRECFADIIDPKGSQTNKNRYVVASQDDEVRTFCREIKGVPLIYVKRSVMIMEPMAESSLGVQKGFENEKMRAGIRKTNAESEGTKRKRNHEDGEDRGINAGRGDDASGSPLVKKTRIRGPKGPNPLSVKKAKPVGAVETSGEPDLTESTAISAKAIEATPSVASTESLKDAGGPSGEVTKSKRKRRRKHTSGGVAKALETGAGGVERESV